jgi:hypothetical protein
MTQLTSEEEAKQDVMAAMAYLGGFLHEGGRGIPQKRYYDEKSTEAQFCRAALTRVLRANRPLDQQLREILATMFDPSPGAWSPWSERVLRAGFRKKPKDHLANSHMAQFVWDRRRAGVPTESAISEAMAKFNVSRERMYQLWRNYRPHFEMVWGPLGS